LDFHLTPEQARLRETIRDFALSTIKPVAESAAKEPDSFKAFLSYKGVYEKVAEMGLTFAHVPKKYGGLGMSSIEGAIITEELSAVDPAFPMGNGFGQTPLLMFGTEEQKAKWLSAPIEAIARGKKDYMCGYLLSEPTGTASFDSSDKSAGITLRAEYKAGEYILNGRKRWPAFVGGWDLKGADQNTFIVRTDPEKGGKEALSALLVPRGTSGIEYTLVEKYAMRTVPTYEVVCKDVRVPEENLIGRGMGDLIASKAWSVVGGGSAIKSVGCARAALEHTLGWARTYTGGSGKPIIQNQVVGYMLFDIAARIEACRYLAWKAAAYIEEHGPEAGSVLLGSMAKVYCSETCLQVIYDCMRVVGINSIDSTHPLNRLFLDASIHPLETGGNIGVHRRRGWGVMIDPGYDPSMLMENRDLPYKKDMEGWGTQFG
jgi:nitroalkane oxidase